MVYQFRGVSVFTGEMVIGELRTHDGIKYIHQEKIKHSEQVKTDTIGILLGLNDSNGKPMYQGDIVNFTYWWFDGQERETNLTGFIVYDSELLSFALDGVKNEEWARHIGAEKGDTDRSAFAFFRFDGDNFEVIGNIHQNPELLK